ncbi:collagen alpha-1(XII) chain [Clonorchis sinensis]|uniref:Collagen alpha-1(XII) chain n=1 Tax=Clonorchis sinensis TaxID=79923 RepID=G7YJJ7_CLOSI|nr:collagen alpha-1(XII) chain [Clonorchis sinensis]
MRVNIRSSTFRIDKALIKLLIIVKASVIDMSMKYSLYLKKRACFNRLRADIVFVVESSDAIDAFSYEFYLKDYLNDIVRKLPIGPNNVMISVVLYSDRLHLAVKPEITTTLPDLLLAIRKLPHLGGSQANVRMETAITETLEGAFPPRTETDADAGILRVAVLMTSGKVNHVRQQPNLSTNGQIKALAQLFGPLFQAHLRSAQHPSGSVDQLKALGRKLDQQVDMVFSIGLQGADQEGVKALTRNPNRVFLIDPKKGYSSLTVDEFDPTDELCPQPQERMMIRNRLRLLLTRLLSTRPQNVANNLVCVQQVNAQTSTTATTSTTTTTTTKSPLYYPPLVIIKRPSPKYHHPHPHGHHLNWAPWNMITKQDQKESIEANADNSLPKQEIATLAHLINLLRAQQHGIQLPYFAGVNENQPHKKPQLVQINNLPQHLPVNAQGSDNQFSAAFIEAFLEAVTGKSERSPGFNQLSDSVPISPTPVSPATTNVPTASTWQDVAMHDGAILMFSVRASSGHSLVNLYTAPIVTNQTDAEWFKHVEFDQWTVGRYRRVMLELWRANQPVVRLTFNAEYADRYTWFQKALLIESFPTTVTHLPSLKVVRMPPLFIYPRQPQHLPVNAQGSDNQFSAAFIEAFLEAVTGKSERSPGFNQLSDSVPISPTPVSPATTNVPTASTWQDVAMHDGAILMFSVRASSGHSLVNLYTAPIVTNQTDAEWFKHVEFDQWTVGRYRRVMLELWRANQPVVRLTFNAEYADRYTWFQKALLIESFPWYENELIQETVFLRSRTEPFSILHTPSTAETQASLTCPQLSGYLLIVDSESSTSACPWLHSDEDRDTKGVQNKTQAKASQFPSFIYTLPAALWSEGVKSGSQVSVSPPRFSDKNGVTRADELRIYAAPYSLVPATANDPFFARTNTLLFALDTMTRIAFGRLWRQTISSPPGYHPYRYNPERHLDKEPVVPACQCWYRSRAIENWHRPTQTMVWHSRSTVLTGFKSTLVQFSDDLGKVVAQLVFDTRGSPADSWFSIARLKYATPWSVKTLRNYNFLQFGQGLSLPRSMSTGSTWESVGLWIGQPVMNSLACASLLLVMDRQMDTGIPPCLKQIPFTPDGTFMAFSEQPVPVEKMRTVRQITIWSV